MIPLKTLTAPPRRKRSIRLDASALTASSEGKKCTLLSWRREGQVLVPAGGAEQVATLRGPCDALFYAGGYALVRGEDGAVTAYPGGQGYSFGTHLPLAAAAYAPYHGKQELYLSASDRLFRLYDNTYDVIAGAPGGTCIAVHRERLYLAGGNKLRYSAPLASGTWALTEEETGEIELSPAGGDILALIPFGSRLFVFRESEILLLRADANGLNFRFERAEFPGSPIAGSVQCTGTGVLFQTARGLAFLNENGSCKLSRTRCMATLLAESAAWEGRYYALAKNGEKDCVYVYDPAADEEFLLDIPATHLAGGSEGVYLVHGTALYRLTGSGFPQEEGTLALELDGSATDGTRRYLAGVTLLGQGNFTAEFAADGLTRRAEVAAGKFVRIMQLLRTGPLALTLKTSDEGAEIRALRLHFEEDAS